MKVTFFCISLHLDSQYLCLWVSKSRHCMPWKPPLCVYKIQAEGVYRIGWKWTKKEKKRYSAKNFLATFQNMAVLVPQMVKNLPEMAGDRGSIPGLGSSPGEGNGNPLQYSCPENPMDRDPGGLQSMGPQWVRHDLETEQQQQSPNTSSTLPLLAATSEAHAP